MNLSERIRDIEAKINRAKTLGLSSSSSLTIAETTITIPFQIVATRITTWGEVMDSGSSKIAYVRIVPEDNAPTMLALRLISPTSFGNRWIATRRCLNYLDGAKYAYSFRIYGSDADTAALDNGQTLPVENYTFKILSTSRITYSIHYEDTEIDNG